MTARAVTLNLAPISAEQAAAVDAATAWLAILDSGDWRSASMGIANETMALGHWPDKENNILAFASLLSVNRTTVNSATVKVTRTLQPDSVKQVTSCECGLRSGNYVVMTYDLKYHWILRNHTHEIREGTDVLYMLQEPDGTWKPASLTFNVKSDKGV